MSEISYLKRATSFILSSALLVSISACGSNNNVNPSLDNTQVNSLAVKPVRGGADWTIMVHLAADNNLYQFGLEDMNEMEFGLDNKNVNVIVMFDGVKQGDSAIYEIKHDATMNKDLISTKVANTVIPASNEVDSGSKEVAAKFVDWATTAYPAKNYGYVIWNHGAGWARDTKSQVAKPVKNLVQLKSEGDIINRSFGYDDNGTHMNTPDLDYILKPVVQKLGRKIDFLDFDACLMAHVEVANQLKDTVDYLVASEKTEPGAGNPYHDILKDISAKSDMNGAEASSTIVKDYGKSYSNGSQGTSTVTLSATDTAKMVSGLVPALNEFAASMTSNLATDGPALQDIRKKTEVYENRDCADIGHFADMVSKDPRISKDVKDKAEKVRKEIGKAVIEEIHSGKPTTRGVANATGLVMYFPYQGMSVNPNYAKLDYSNQGWDEFLQAFVK